MLTMIHSNSASVDGGVFRVDRKFHIGMLCYAESIRTPLATVHPQTAGPHAMDMVELRCDELPYQVLTIKTDKNQQPLPDQTPLLEKQIASSASVYGTDMGGAVLARLHGVPYIHVDEYDLQTQIIVSRLRVSSIFRKAARSARVTWRHATRTLVDVKLAAGVHCNGYPVYDELCRFNANCLLYLDSRMSADIVIPHRVLETRLLDRIRGRRVRLLYSGRYEHLKGAIDVVKVAVEAISRGLDIELHCYGSGSLGEQMKRLANESGEGRIYIHDAVTYPELIGLARDFDVFVCCHIQGDPSCSYLESFGSGLPIVGYGIACGGA